MSCWRGCFGSSGVERDDPYFPQIPWLETLGYRQVEWKEPWIEDQDVGFCSQHLGHVSHLPFGLNPIWTMGVGVHNLESRFWFH